MTISATPMTAEELFNSSHYQKNYELVHGELITMAPAGDEHGARTARITLRVGNYIEKHQLGELFIAETGFLLSTNPDTVRAPDFAFLSNDRLAKQPLTGKFYPGAPDLAVEVLSPSDSASDMNERIDDYLAAGTHLLWVIDPKTKTVTTYAPDRQPTILRLADTLSGEKILPGFTLPVADIFR